MRLDHLLSKEHLPLGAIRVARATSRADLSISDRRDSGWSAQGWNVDDVLPERSGESVRPACGSGSLAGVGMVACTLLGPEGSARVVRSDPRLPVRFPSDFLRLPAVPVGGGVPIVC